MSIKKIIILTWTIILDGEARQFIMHVFYTYIVDDHLGSNM